MGVTSMHLQIAKDMERWAKAQNKKKEETKKVDENVNSTKKQSLTGRPALSGAPIVFSVITRLSLGDIGFSLLEKRVHEEERRANISNSFTTELYKPSNVPMGAVSFLDLNLLCLSLSRPGGTGGSCRANFYATPLPALAGFRVVARDSELRLRIFAIACSVRCGALCILKLRLCEMKICVYKSELN